MNQAILQLMKDKTARIDLVRGIKHDLIAWGLDGNIEQITQILLRIEQYQNMTGEVPFNFGPDTKS